ncbi:MAG: DUF916 domain-containing protein [Gammaproteobacteria bacterium]|nr:DUF916 domain-containing protein [Gammaproteobacteria bacterium]MDH5653402.1 DUF916 domain-containing protein [Gammaproteobacteria bacterium]
MDKEDDPLSGDCGGDCWGCIGEIEADSGFEPSLEMVRQEFRDGYRNNWIPAPTFSYEIIGDIHKSSEIRLRIKLVRPLGEPWPNETVELKVYLRNLSTHEEVEITNTLVTTNLDGVIQHDFKYKSHSVEQELWFHIKRGSEIWAYPIR